MSDTSGRQSKRTPVTLKIKFKSATLDQFIERYSVDVSQGGIFIRTKDPLAVGTQLRFEFQLQDASPLIGGEGTVVWTREFDPSRVGVAPGMGVRFDKLGPESMVVLERILAQKNKDVVEPKFDGPPSQLTTKVTPAGLAGTLAAQGRPAGTPATRPAVAAQRVPTTNASPPPLHKQTMLGYAAAERPVPRVGHLAPPRGGFPEEPSKDATPLPKPMPFHAVADDDFSDDVFDQPTKVASLETLLKQEEEQARAARQALVEAGAAAALASAGAVGDATGPVQAFEDEEVDEAKTSVRKKPLPPAVVDAPAVSDGMATEPVRPRPRFTPMGISAQELKHEDEPRFLKEGRPIARPSSPRPAVVPPPLDAPKSSWVPIAIVASIALVAGAAALYVFVIKPSEEPAPRARPASELLSPVADPGKPGPAAPAVGAAPATKSTVDIDVTSVPNGASVEIDGQAKGTTPTKILALAAGKTYKLVVKAACFKDGTTELSPKADAPQPTVDMRLTPLDRVLRVTTEPSNARLSVNGKAVGTTPSEVKLTGAPARVRATLPGYAVSEATIPVDAPCVTEGDVGVVALKLALAQNPVSTEPAAAPVPPPAKKTMTRDPAPPRPVRPRPPAAVPAAKPGKPAKNEKAVIVSPLQPIPTGPVEPAKPDEGKDVAPSLPQKEPPVEAPPKAPPPPEAKETKEAPPPVVEPPKEPVKEAPKETHAPKSPTPAPAPKDRITPPREAPLPNKECDPSPDAPEWARCK